MLDSSDLDFTDNGNTLFAYQFEVWLIISMVNTDEILLFIYEITLIVIKPVGVKTYINFLFSVYESKRNLSGCIIKKSHMCSSFSVHF